MDKHRQEKVLSFEEFIDRQLKPDLIRAIGIRYPSQCDLALKQRPFKDVLFVVVVSSLQPSSDLKRNIENLEKNGVTSLHTMVNLGSEVYMQADVPDTRHIFVDVGLGFHVEFTWSEAVKFISEKEKRIEMQIEEYTRLIASIKSRIKLVGGGIREILQLQAE